MYVESAAAPGALIAACPDRDEPARGEKAAGEKAGPELAGKRAGKRVSWLVQSAGGGLLLLVPRLTTNPGCSLGGTGEAMWRNRGNDLADTRSLQR